jgi:hypothetical protein
MVHASRPHIAAGFSIVMNILICYSALSSGHRVPETTVTLISLPI